MALTYDIKTVLAGFYENIKTFDENYQSSFQSQGQKKLSRYKDQLESIITDENPNEIIFLSVGAADGSEIEAISNNFNITSIIANEIDDSALEKLHKLKSTMIQKA